MTPPGKLDLCLYIVDSFGRFNFENDCLAREVLDKNHYSITKMEDKAKS